MHVQVKNPKTESHCHENMSLKHVFASSCGLAFMSKIHNKHSSGAWELVFLQSVLIPGRS